MSPMTDAPAPGRIEFYARFAAIGLISAVLVFLSLTFAREAGRVASIWPLNAFLLSVLLQRPSLNWRAVLIAGAIANVAVDVAMGDAFVTAGLLTFANMLEVGLCFYLLGGRGRAFDITRGADLFRFILVAGVIGPAVSSVIAAAALSSAAPFFNTLGIWFAADALGLLVFTPALLALARKVENSAYSRARTIEFIASMAVIAVVSALVFGQERYPVLFLVPPALTFATFRLGIGGAAAGVLVVAAFAIGFAVAGHGPIQLIDGDDTEKIFVLQAFLALMCLTTLPIAAALAEAERTREDLRTSRENPERAHLAAQQSERHYRTLADYSTDLVIRVGRDGVISYASPASRRILGLTPEEIAGRPALDFVLDEDRAYAASLLQGLFTGAEPDRSIRREFRVKRKDGAIVWIEGNPSIIRNDAGDPTEVITTYRDVTARRELEDALMGAREAAEAAAARASESELRYRTMSDISLDMIARMGLDGTIRFVSPSCLAIMGYTPEELVGTTTLEHTHPDDIPAVKLLFQELLAEGPSAKPRSYAFRARRKDGVFIWLEGIPRIVYNEAGKPVEIQDSARDITVRKRLEQALAEARLEAESAAAAKSEFLANMSHEIRTPLNTIVGFSRLLERSAAIPAGERRYASLVSTSANALLAIVNDILDVSALDAGAVKLEQRSFNPAVLAEQTVDALKLNAQSKGLELVLSVKGATRPLLGDDTRLRQALTNLVGNAIKFTQSGAIDVVVSSEPSPSGHRLRVEVSDTGIGIADNKLGQLFQRFSQADASVSRRFGGSGLGLAITKNLIDLMGGRIGVESREGAGSKFWFEVELPLAPACADMAPSSAPVQKARQRILVVDDVDVNRELLGVLLASHDVSYAADGAEALAAIRKDAFDLVFMDVQMPGMDGLSATRAVREDPSFAALPIIALTAHALPEQIIAIRVAGMSDYLAKPVETRALEAAVAKWTGATAPTSTSLAAPLESLRLRFVERCAQDLNTLRLSDRVGDGDAIRHVVHRLAGAGATFGYDDAGQAALAADQIYANGALPTNEDLQRVVEALEAICARSSACLSNAVAVGCTA